MKNKCLTIRKMITYLNNEIEEGGFWLPNIQRDFVWDEDQIEKLLDSILREYPIGTLLIWKTKSSIKYRRFISCYSDGHNKIDDYETPNTNQKLLVLDGQQRLQSLYIALKGSYNGKEMYFDVLSQNNGREDIKYKFKFMSDENNGSWIKLKDLVYSNKKARDVAREIIIKLKNNDMKLERDDENIIEDNIAQLMEVFNTQEFISYQELDSVDNDSIYRLNDIVEIFIRANSGGTKLEKTELLFALLTVKIEDIEERLKELISELNRTGYEFGKDYILKVCLVLIGVGSKYDVDKFRNEKNIQLITENFDDIGNCIKDVKDFVYEKAMLRNDDALGAYIPLIPLIYLRYINKKEFYRLENKGLAKWIIKVIFTGIFNGTSDSFMDECIKEIESSRTISFDRFNDIFINKNKTLDITEKNILLASYGNNQNNRRKLYLLFNLWYSNFNFKPSFKGNEPNIDHIFPQSLLKSIKEVSSETGRQVMKYKDADRNRIGNCMLLSAQENGAGGKCDIIPEEWFKDKDDSYFEMHLIPKDRNLLKVENYDKFIEEREKVIIEKFKTLL